jgi:hypothetical protein
MGSINVRVSDISGSRINEVEAPDDVPVNRILVVLIERMNLPLNSPDGQLMSYKLHHRRTGQQLLDNQTLAQAAVTAGDELRLQPEITAGSAKRGSVRRSAVKNQHASDDSFAGGLGICCGSQTRALRQFQK